MFALDKKLKNEILALVFSLENVSENKSLSSVKEFYSRCFKDYFHRFAILTKTFSVAKYHVGEGSMLLPHFPIQKCLSLLHLKWMIHDFVVETLQCKSGRAQRTRSLSITVVAQHCSDLRAAAAIKVSAGASGALYVRFCGRARVFGDFQTTCFTIATAHISRT